MGWIITCEGSERMEINKKSQTKQRSLKMGHAFGKVWVYES